MKLSSSRGEQDEAADDEEEEGLSEEQDEAQDEDVEDEEDQSSSSGSEEEEINSSEDEQAEAAEVDGEEHDLPPAHHVNSKPIRGSRIRSLPFVKAVLPSFKDVGLTPMKKFETFEYEAIVGGSRVCCLNGLL